MKSLKIKITKFSKLSLAMLILLSAAFFVVPAKQEVQAQAGRNTSICFNESTGQTVRPSTTSACPSGSTIISVPRNGICVFRSSNSPVRYDWSDPSSVDANGVGTCAQGDFRSITSMSVYNPGGGTPTTPPTGGNANNGGNNTNTGGTTTTPPSTGGCETGFHKVGPLCVPNSPFNNSESITGEQTIGGLAARIIRILLYFAGIVAVIMMIIGGYQIMTAAGNESQAKNGRKTLTNAIIGLVIIILSYIIIQAVISFVT